MFYQGPSTPKILFVSDFQRVHCYAEGKVFSEWLGQPLYNAIKKAGLRSEEYGFLALHDVGPRGDLRGLSTDTRQADLDNFRGWLSSCTANVIVPLGEYALELLTGLTGIGKWQCSVVSTRATYGGRKCLPMFHPEYVSRAYGDHFYLTLGCQKLAKEKESPLLKIPERKFITHATQQEAIAYLHDRVARAETVAVDWEFGRGQLNTLGFAVSATEAIAIRCLPGDFEPDAFYRLFKAVQAVAEGPVHKVVQHGLIETTWLARYGIVMQNIVHDTMWAMKFLHPEFDKGLDNVGRVYTPYPYWKDDNDDWSQISNWQQHLEYNCKDTTGTFAAYETQTAALKARGLTETFQWVMRFAPVIQEMCTTGLRVSPAAIQNLRDSIVRQQENYQRIIDEACLEALGKTINVRSPKQLKEALVAMGMKLPTKKVKGKNEEQTTADKKALVKLKRKYPKAEILPALVGISAANKRLSAYTDFDYDKITSRVHYTLDGCGTETGRWAGYKSAWGEGFNPQTVPKAVRSCFIADPGTVLIQIDLKQAESRYVAWDGPDHTLMQLIEDNRDIHRYVAGRIHKKSEEMVTNAERQLGKKAGHAANYGTGPRTFAEACLVEMDLFISEQEARNVLNAYFETFPGIRRRQETIRQTVYNKRCLKTPLGRERYFYGRMDDATFREAYAYCPQSTIPDITNNLMLHLWDNRDYLGLAWEDSGRFLLQVHDSLLLQARPERVADIAAFCRDLSAWHPYISLAGGQLLIPTDVEVGTDWKNMEKV